MHFLTKRFSKIFIGSIIILLLGCFIIFHKKGLLYAIDRIPESLATIHEKNIRASNTWNKQEVDSAIRLLQDGDLVLRRGIDISSYLLCKMNRRDQSYSHCGLVMMEHGYPFVYHSIGGEDNPDEEMRRDSALLFFSPAQNLNFGVARYQLSDTEKCKLSQTIKQFYTEHRKFDMDFDLKSDDRLYCSEFVYKALRIASNDSYYIVPTHTANYTFAGIDDLYLNPHARLILQVKFK